MECRHRPEMSWCIAKLEAKSSTRQHTSPACVEGEGHALQPRGGRGYFHAAPRTRCGTYRMCAGKSSIEAMSTLNSIGSRDKRWRVLVINLVVVVMVEVMVVVVMVTLAVKEIMVMQERMDQD
ncbi:hypothetical protein E2C01_067201 [Portunus trituberculatus]|uniref:Uncharacterized protein n=1 Tax=Portunus trituberculatus TaxID=210409 RepID=A0A5B7HW03_PORTR|nr:hypothetical protein [Portunus trituberculatus]